MIKKERNSPLFESSFLFCYIKSYALSWLQELFTDVLLAVHDVYLAFLRRIDFYTIYIIHTTVVILYIIADVGDTGFYTVYFYCCEENRIANATAYIYCFLTRILFLISLKPRLKEIDAFMISC